MNLAKTFRKRDNVAYLLILPNVLIYLVFILLPLARSFLLSFTDYNLFNSHFVGFANYIELFKDNLFLISFKNTIIYSVFTILPSMVIGLMLAIALNGKVVGAKAFRTIFYMPNVISVICASMAWSYIYDSSNGILNKMLLAVGLPQQAWLMNPSLALPAVIVMSIWQSQGYNMIVYLSGLQSIPEYLYEAAMIDGASKVRQFFKITLPMLAPTTFFIFVMATISSFQVFGQIYSMTNGGPMNATSTLVFQIYQNAFINYKMGYASAIAVVLFLMTLIITLINFKSGNQGGDGDIG